MEKEILTIDFEIPGYAENNKSFFSDVSLMDADIVLFHPYIPYSSSDYDGLPSLSESSSRSYRDAVPHWQNELNAYLESGKTVFLFLSKKESFYVKTGRAEHKAKQTINYVDLRDNYEFLPVNVGTISSARGEGIVNLGKAVFSEYYRCFGKLSHYEAYLNTNTASAFFVGKDRSKVLGAAFKVRKGHLVILPCLSFEDESFTYYSDEEEREYWNEDAISLGDELLKCLARIDSDLRHGVTSEEAPDWVKLPKFMTHREGRLRAQAEKKATIIEEAKAQLESINLDIKSASVLKGLLYAQGKELEHAVTHALKLLGYSAEGYDDGVLELDQIILSPEGHRYIGECEGKERKDVDVSKFRQLLDGLHADFEKEEIESRADGILFGNAHRLIEPEKRSSCFTKKCQSGAEREGIALVKTIDLFDVAKYLTDNDDSNFQQQCREAIHDARGKIVVFPPVPANQKRKASKKP
jgi:hypothetical protein